MVLLSCTFLSASRLTKSSVEPEFPMVNTTVWLQNLSSEIIETETMYMSVIGAVWFRF